MDDADLDRERIRVGRLGERRIDRKQASKPRDGRNAAGKSCFIEDKPPLTARSTMSSRYRRFDGRARARSDAQQAPSAPQLVPSDNFVGIRPSRLKTPILDGLRPTHRARRTRCRQKHLSRSIEAFIAGGRTAGIAGLDSVENTRPSAQIRSLEPPVSSRGQLALFRSQEIFRSQRTDARSDARLPASLHVDPPFSGGQTRGPSHLRRQIGGNFHACANFDDDRNIPGHEPNSSSFSPCGVISIPRPCN